MMVKFSIAKFKSILTKIALKELSEMVFKNFVAFLESEIHRLVMFQLM